MTEPTNSEAYEVARDMALLFLRSGGGFSLATGVYNTRAAAQSGALELAESLATEGVSLLVLNATGEQAHPERLMEDLQAALKDGSTYEGVVVYGFPPYGAKGQEAYFRTLNLDRELFPSACPLPTLFCFSLEGFRSFAQNAPDLQHWSPHQFDFMRPLSAASPSIEQQQIQLETSRPGRTYTSLAELEGAEKIFRDALAVNETARGVNHPESVLSRANLANVLHQRAQLTEALALAEKNVEILSGQGQLGNYSESEALGLCSLILEDLNRLEEAEAMCRRALLIAEEAYGSEHPNVADNLNNLAHMLKSMNRVEESERLIRRTLRIYKSVYSDSHPDVVVSLNNLAQLLKATNRLVEAEPLMRKALVLTNKVFGGGHPFTAICLSNLAKLLKATNRLEEAERLMKQALAVTEKAYGPTHPNVAISFITLAQLLRDTDRHEEAKLLSRKSLETLIDFTKSTGNMHRFLKDAVDNYSAILLEMGCSAAEVKVELDELWNKA